MIIYGTRGRETTAGGGRFFCPQCRDDANYQHQKVKRYFTLYFIPLFPMDTLGEFVRCQGCKGEYDMKVLNFTREVYEAAMQPWSCPSCGNANTADHSDCVNCGAQRP
jgi:hypothetical protein